MTPIAVKDLLEAGVHFGHQTKRWNPKMKPYIFGERNGIYIIDLGKTARLFRHAEQFVMQLASEGRTLLFVGTKRQAQDAIAEEAQRCGMFHVNQRWLGGLLTNFTTIQRSLARLRDLEAMETDGRYDALSKKEIARLEKEKRKLQKNLDGIRHMDRLPDAVFIVDNKNEQMAVDEARKLRIPIIGIVDTNCEPDQVDYAIPGNDDALRAIRLFAARIADAVLAGRGGRESATAEQAPVSDGSDGSADSGRSSGEPLRAQQRPLRIAAPPAPGQPVTAEPTASPQDEGASAGAAAPSTEPAAPAPV
ncbi:MAG: 30S ribosomal protein S2 [Luteitalea sp.]